MTENGLSWPSRELTSSIWRRSTPAVEARYVGVYFPPFFFHVSPVYITRARTSRILDHTPINSLCSPDFSKSSVVCVSWLTSKGHHSAPFSDVIHVHLLGRCPSFTFSRGVITGAWPSSFPLPTEYLLTFSVWKMFKFFSLSNPNTRLFWNQGHSNIHYMQKGLLS